MDLSMPVLAFWLPASFFLHNGMHEGSHALAATAMGGRVAEFNLFPSMKEGRLAFGYTSYEIENNDRKLSFVAIAPVIVEVVYFATVITLIALVDMPKWMRTMLFVEAISSMIDIAMWWSGAFARHDPNVLSQNDATSFSNRSRVDRSFVRFAGLPLLATQAVALSVMF